MKETKAKTFYDPGNDWVLGTESKIICNSLVYLHWITLFLSVESLGIQLLGLLYKYIIQVGKNYIFMSGQVVTQHPATSTPCNLVQPVPWLKV